MEMNSLDATIGVLHVLGDSTRVRLLCLLERDELTVAELTTITELPQSRVSTHLGRLREAGFVRDRRVGANSFYALNEGAIPSASRQLWQLVRSELSDGVLEADRGRAEQLRQARQTALWPDSIAGEMERHYSPGRTWEATARGLLGFIELGEVLDVCSGDGAIAQLFAPRVRSITCLDKSERVIEAARRRLSACPNVRFCVADMHSLPFDPHSFDTVLLFNALTYAEAPDRAVAEAARVLRIGGTLALITLRAHSHLDVTNGYGHLHAGFSVAELRALLNAAGLVVRSSEVTSRERKKPYFEVISAFAVRPPSTAT